MSGLTAGIRGAMGHKGFTDPSAGTDPEIPVSLADGVAAAMRAPGTAHEEEAKVIQQGADDQAKAQEEAQEEADRPGLLKRAGQGLSRQSAGGRLVESVFRAGSQSAAGTAESLAQRAEAPAVSAPVSIQDLNPVVAAIRRQNSGNAITGPDPELAAALRAEGQRITDVERIRQEITADTAVPEAEGVLENLASGVGTLAGDLPLIAGGAAAAGRVVGRGAANLIPRAAQQASALAAGFMTPEALASASEVASGQKTGVQAVEDVGKAGVIGAATGAAGGVVAPGSIGRILAGGALETGALTGTAAALEGRLPTADELVTNALLIGALRTPALRNMNRLTKIAAKAEAEVNAAITARDTAIAETRAAEPRLLADPNIILPAPIKGVKEALAQSKADRQKLLAPQKPAPIVPDIEPVFKAKTVSEKPIAVEKPVTPEVTKPVPVPKSTPKIRPISKKVAVLAKADKLEKSQPDLTDPKTGAIRIPSSKELKAAGKKAQEKIEAVADKVLGEPIDKRFRKIEAKRAALDPTTVDRAGDINLARVYLSSSRRATRGHKEGSEVSQDLLNASLISDHATTREAQLFTDAMIHLPKAELPKTHEATEFFRKNGKNQTVAKYGPDLARTAETFTTHYDAKLVKIKESFRRVHKIRSQGTQLGEAFEAVVDGKMSLEAAVQKFQPTGVKDTTPKLLASKQRLFKAAVESTVAKYEEISNFGLKDYVSKLELGTYQVKLPLGPKGKDGKAQNVTIAMGETWQDAVFKAKERLETEYKQFTVDDIVIERKTVGLADSNFLTESTVQRVVKALKDPTEAELSVITAELTGKLKSRRTPSATRQKTTGAFQKRRGILKGEENLFDTIFAYNDAINRTLMLNEALARAEPKMAKIPPNTRLALERQIETIRGRRFVTDQIVDKMFQSLADVKVGKEGAPLKSVRGIGKKLDVRPGAARRAAGKLRGSQAVKKLGGRLVGGVMNATHGGTKTWVMTSGSSWKKAVGDVRTARRKPASWQAKALEQAEPLLGLDFEVEGVGRGVTGTSSMSNLRRIATALSNKHYAQAAGSVKAGLNPVRVFSFPEKALRQHSYFANLDYLSKQEAGKKMSRAELELDAAQAVQMQQFIYNAAALPEILRGPTTSVVGQFKSYMSFEAELITSMTGAQRSRYLGAYLTLGGPKALTYFLRSLPFMGAMGIWDTLDLKIDKTFPGDTERGVLGALTGADFTAPLVPQLEAGLGPSVADALEFNELLLKPTLKGEAAIDENINEYLKATIPAMRSWIDYYDAAVSPDGWIRDSRGNPVHKIIGPEELIAAIKTGDLKTASKGTGDLVRGIAAASPSDKTRLSSLNRWITGHNRSSDASKERLMKKLRREVDKLVKNPKHEIPLELFTDLRAFGATSDTINQGLDSKNQLPAFKAWGRVRKIDQVTVIEWMDMLSEDQRGGAVFKPEKRKASVGGFKGKPVSLSEGGFKGKPVSKQKKEEN